MNKEEEEEEAHSDSCKKKRLTPGFSTVAVYVLVGFLELFCSS